MICVTSCETSIKANIGCKRKVINNLSYNDDKIVFAQAWMSQIKKDALKKLFSTIYEF